MWQKTSVLSFSCHRLYIEESFWLLCQCADDPEAVCTRSVTLSLPSLENMTVKLKHGGLVSVNSMDIQTPMHHGKLFQNYTVFNVFELVLKHNGITTQIKWILNRHVGINKGKIINFDDLLFPLFRYAKCFVCLFFKSFFSSFLFKKRTSCECNLTGHLQIARYAQSSVRVKFGDDFRLDWDGRGRVLLKVKQISKTFLAHEAYWNHKPARRSEFWNYPPSWGHDGRGRPVVSVATTMVTMETTSCLVVDWSRQVLRCLVKLGGSMEIVNPHTSMSLTLAPLTQNEVSSAN